MCVYVLCVYMFVRCMYVLNILNRNSNRGTLMNSVTSDADNEYKCVIMRVKEGQVHSHGESAICDSWLNRIIFIIILNILINISNSFLSKVILICLDQLPGLCNPRCKILYTVDPRVANTLDGGQIDK